MKHLKLLSLLLSFVLLFSLFGCDKEDEKTTGSETESNAEEIYYTKLGNTPGNLANGGGAALYGEWLFFTTDRGIYREKTDGSICEKISGVTAGDLNVCEDWLYFIDFEKYYCYRMRHDGSELELFDTGIRQLFIVDDYIYYSTMGSDSNNLYRTDHDKTEKLTVIHDIYHNHICVTESAIYWYDFDNTYSCDLDGKNMICYEGVNGQELIVAGGKMYSSGRLTVSNVDGTEAVTLEEHAFSINYHAGWIYFVKIDEDNCIYRIKKDGTGLQKLVDGYSGELCIAGNWLFFTIYTKYTDDGTYYVPTGYYRIRLDGTGEIENLHDLA